MTSYLTVTIVLYTSEALLVSIQVSGGYLVHFLLTLVSETGRGGAVPGELLMTYRLVGLMSIVLLLSLAAFAVLVDHYQDEVMDELAHTVSEVGRETLRTASYMLRLRAGSDGRAMVGNRHLSAVVFLGLCLQACKDCLLVFVGEFFVVLLQELLDRDIVGNRC